MVLMAELMKKSVASTTSADSNNYCYQNENRYDGSHNHSNIVVAAVIIVIVIVSVISCIAVCSCTAI